MAILRVVLSNFSKKRKMFDLHQALIILLSLCGLVLKPYSQNVSRLSGAPKLMSIRTALVVQGVFIIICTSQQQSKQIFPKR